MQKVFSQGSHAVRGSWFSAATYAPTGSEESNWFFLMVPSASGIPILPPGHSKHLSSRDKTNFYQVYVREGLLLWLK